MIPNGVDLRRLHPSSSRAELRAGFHLAPDARVLLSLAALTWERVQLAHIDVASRVLAQRPDAVHLVAGDGPMRDDVDRKVRSLGLEGRIRILGSRADVPDLMSVSDVLSRQPTRRHGRDAHDHDRGGAIWPPGRGLRRRRRWGGCSQRRDRSARPLGRRGGAQRGGVTLALERRRTAAVDGRSCQNAHAASGSMSPTLPLGTSTYTRSS